MRLMTSLLCLAMGFHSTAFAKFLTPEEALKLTESSSACKVVSKNNTSRMVLTFTEYEKQSDKAAVYVFQPSNTDSGFLVLAADDCMGDIVLGYSDTDAFNSDNIPPAMRWMLDSYAKRIAKERMKGTKTPMRIKVGDVAQSARRAPAQAIAPLIKTQWGQVEPFNNNCPLVGGYRSVTGCVATAMAQIMKYHEWPKQGNSKLSYKFISPYDEKEYTTSADFGATTYNWTYMLNSYANGATTTQKNAVATLMHHCGVASMTNYGPERSGSNELYAGNGLLLFFDYDPSLSLLYRFWFTDEEWESVIYDQLAQKQPVLFSGINEDIEGHAFVCDGYDGKGYFHINWGWCGNADGYFDLASLDPDGQGTGGSSDIKGFDYAQSIICNIKKQAGSEPSQSWMLWDDFQPEKNEYSISSNNTVTFNCTWRNLSYLSPTVIVGVKLVSANQTKYLTYNSFNDSEYWDLYENIKIPSTSFPVGEYDIYPAYYAAGEWHTMYYDKTVEIDFPHAVVTSTSIKFANEAEPSGSAVTESFENAETFAQTVEGWTIYDMDGGPAGGLEGLEIPGHTYGESPMGWFVMENNNTAHSGTKFMSTMYNVNGKQNDEWLISPLLCGEAQTISLWARSINSNYGLESMELLYSTTNTSVSSFVSARKVAEVPDTWTKYTFQVPAGTKYFAIRCTSQDIFMLFVDDVTYIPYAQEPAEVEVTGELRSITANNQSVEQLYINSNYDFTYTISTDGKWEKEVVCLIFDTDYTIQAYSTAQNVSFSGAGKKDYTFNVSTANIEEGVYAVALAYPEDDKYLYLISESVMVISLLSQENPYQLGDVNGNGEVNTNDAIAIVNHVVGKAQPVFIEEVADVNGNGEINTNDAIAIVNFVVGKTNSLKVKPREDAANFDVISTLNTSNNQIAMNLTNEHNYLGFQFEITVPDGMTVENIVLSPERSNNHELFFNKTGSNKYMVAALSLQGNSLLGNSGDLLTITTKGHGELNLSNLLFFTDMGQEVQLNAPSATSINSIPVTDYKTDRMFDISGRRISRSPEKGIYINNNKKIFVK